MADSSKTEKATPKKRRDERKKGHVSMSKDAVAVATLFGSVFVLRSIFPGAVLKLRQFFRYCLTLAADNTVEPFPPELMPQAVSIFIQVAAPALAVTILLAVIATFAQTRMLVTFEPLKPKFSHLNPIKGFQRLFSLRSVVEALKGMLKISILLALIYFSLRDMMYVAQGYLYADVTGACAHILRALFTMLMKVGLAFMVIAAADYLYQRWDFEKQMKMTKEEVKEEYKQTEGDPKVKGRIRQIQRQMAQSRMMQQVPQADVVVRNPTHFAVALRYHNGEDTAPVVLAKGQDHLAMKIVSVAEEHGIICIENVPLARALYAKTELNGQIPPDLYEPVAEVLVYLYKLGRLKGGRQAAMEPPAGETGAQEA